MSSQLDSSLPFIPSPITRRTWSLEIIIGQGRGILLSGCRDIVFFGRIWVVLVRINYTGYTGLTISSLLHERGKKLRQKYTHTLSESQQPKIEQPSFVEEAFQSQKIFMSRPHFSTARYNLHTPLLYLISSLSVTNPRLIPKMLFGRVTTFANFVKNKLNWLEQKNGYYFSQFSQFHRKIKHPHAV